MASRREDLPSRCLSLLKEIKDLIETHNSEQSGSENVNSSETAQRVSRPSSSLPQTQVSNQQRVMQNFRTLFAPFSAGGSSCRRPPAKKPWGYFQVKETWTHDFFLSCVHICRLRSATSPENSFTKRRAGAKKSCFSKQRIFCRCKGKTGDCLPKIERWWRFWITKDGLSKFKACSNISPGWRIFSALPAGCCGTWPGTGLYQATPNGPRHVSGWKGWAAWAGMCFQLQQLIRSVELFNQTPHARVSINWLSCGEGGHSL